MAGPATRGYDDRLLVSNNAVQGNRTIGKPVCGTLSVFSLALSTHDGGSLPKTDSCQGSVLEMILSILVTLDIDRASHHERYEENKNSEHMIRLTITYSS